MKGLLAGLVIAGATFVVAVPAAPQGDRIVTGQLIELSNGTECAPGAEGSIIVQVGAEAVAASAAPIATFVADSTGHFEVTLPDTFRPGPGEYSIVVSCGAQGGDLVYPVTVVAASDTPIWQQPMVLAAAAAVLVLGVLLVTTRRKRAGSELGAAMAAEAQIAEPMSFAAAPAAADDDDDGAEYWVWDVVTEAGSRKRVACLTEQCFHLHELGEDEFAGLLQMVQEIGPDAALARSFFRTPVADIGDVARRDHLLRIVTKNGREQVIDLGTASPDVFAMLRRRLGDAVCREISTGPTPQLATVAPTPVSVGHA